MVAGSSCRVPHRRGRRRTPHRGQRRRVQRRRAPARGEGPVGPRTGHVEVVRGLQERDVGHEGVRVGPAAVRRRRDPLVRALLNGPPRAASSRTSSRDAPSARETVHPPSPSAATVTSASAGWSAQVPPAGVKVVATPASTVANFSYGQRQLEAVEPPPQGRVVVLPAVEGRGPERREADAAIRGPAPPACPRWPRSWRSPRRVRAAPGRTARTRRRPGSRGGPSRTGTRTPAASPDSRLVVGVLMCTRVASATQSSGSSRRPPRPRAAGTAGRAGRWRPWWRAGR